MRTIKLILTCTMFFTAAIAQDLNPPSTKPHSAKDHISGDFDKEHSLMVQRIRSQVRMLKFSNPEGVKQHTMQDLTTALQSWESAQDALNAANSNLDAANTKRDDAAAKLAAAQSAADAAAVSRVDAARAYNTTVDELVAALVATKMIVPDPAPVPTSN